MIYSPADTVICKAVYGRHGNAAVTGILRLFHHAAFIILILKKLY